MLRRRFFPPWTRALRSLRKSRTPSQGATADGISDAALEEAKEQFAPVQIEKTQLAALMSADADTISALFQATRTLVNDALNSYISEGQENDTVSSIARELAKTYDTSLVALASNVVRALSRRI